MSEPTLFQPYIGSQACIRSFALASKAKKISPKAEIIILSRLMSATLGYNSAFWGFLKADNAAPFRDCIAMAGRSKRGSFLTKSDISDKDHAGFVADAKFLFEDLNYYADKFDRERETESGAKKLIKIAVSFLAAQESAQKDSMENGLPALNYINPYVAINVAAAVMFDIFKDIEHAQPDKSAASMESGIESAYDYLDQVTQDFPVNFAPNIDAIACKNDEVRSRIIGTYQSLEDLTADIPNVHGDVAHAAKYGLASVKGYLSPFVRNIKEKRLDKPATILTFSEWSPLVEMTREKQAKRGAQAQSIPTVRIP